MLASIISPTQLPYTYASQQIVQYVSWLVRESLPIYQVHQYLIYITFIQRVFFLDYLIYSLFFQVWRLE